MNILDTSSFNDQRAYDELLARIERERSVSCLGYKDRCLRRRIGVRMRAAGVHTVGDYSRVLDGVPGEWDKLMATLTINVTRFFRDDTAFAALERQAYPLLRERFSDPLRVWSAGCSHGQEAYSLAIGLAESVGVGRTRMDATDIDTESLAAASAATYPEPVVADISFDRRQRWLTNATPATVRPTLRDTVTVRRHDLLRDAIPEQRYHLIACRNVIIYFSREAQSELFAKLYHALVPGGLLLLGKVETLVGPARELFTAVNLRERLFERPMA